MQLLIPSLSKGQYIIQIGTDGDFRGTEYSTWQLEIICSSGTAYPMLDKAVVVPDSDYILYAPEENIEWFEAVNKCEQLYGTTLATITTHYDFEEAINVINSAFTETSYYNVSVWIGLYSTMDQNWKWIDGTSCQYTISGNCIDDTHWLVNKPDVELLSNYNSSYIHRFGATLFVTVLAEHANKNILSGFEKWPFDVKHVGFVLCNAPKSRYNVQKCSINGCWYQQNKFSDYFIVGMLNPFIGYWNSTLFIIGRNQVHYTNWKLFDNDYIWHHTIYNHTNNEASQWNNARLYAQHESSLYMYGTYFNFELMCNQASLLRIDLSTLMTFRDDTDMRETIPLATKCIVADKNFVYVIQQARIFRYSMYTKVLLPAPRFNTRFTEKTACIITNDEKFIYIFSMSYDLDSYNQFMTVKYDLSTDKITHIQTSDTISNKPHSVMAVVAPDKNIYLHGCHASSWKTMKYDTQNESFTNTTIDINVPEKTDMPYYRSSKLIAVDDNILFMYSLNRNQNQILSYHSVTHEISINFKETKLANIWPSDAIDIRYFINDFTYFQKKK
eukprot:117848_1